ncbi:MAG TPA: peptidase S1 [Peptococcaceae bacterium]|nr:peptidase S1 [Peptococcaceae bacterium]
MERSGFKTALVLVFIFLAGVLIGGIQMGVFDFDGKQPESQGIQQQEDVARLQTEKPEASQRNIMADDTVRNIVARCGDSVVKIETQVTMDSSSNPLFNDPFFEEFFGDSLQEEQQQQGLGSGFIFSEDGYILTNNHVIQGAEKIMVYLSLREEPYEAVLVGQAPDLDLAVIKIISGTAFPFLTLGDSNLVAVGDWIVAIGNPYGLDHTVTVGVISATGRPLTIEGTLYQNLFQTDAAINPGNSGGPMLNLDGEVIGLNTAVNASAQGIGFAIPSSTIQGVIDDLKAGNSRIRPWMGITMQDLTPDLAAYFNLDITEGVIINTVVEGAPADKAGLQRGDIILSMDGQTVSGSEQLQSLVRSRLVGDSVEIVISRDGVEMNFVIKLEASES